MNARIDRTATNVCGVDGDDTVVDFFESSEEGLGEP